MPVFSGGDNESALNDNNGVVSGSNSKIGKMNSGKNSGNQVHVHFGDGASSGTGEDNKVIREQWGEIQRLKGKITEKKRLLIEAEERVEAVEQKIKKLKSAYDQLEKEKNQEIYVLRSELFEEKRCRGEYESQAERGRKNLEHQLKQSRSDKEQSDRRWWQLLNQESNRTVVGTAYAEWIFRGLFEMASQIGTEVDFTPKHPEIRIAIMGPPGSGKSSFMELLTRETYLKVGFEADPSTPGVRPGYFFHPDGRCVVLVDIPGFHDCRKGFKESENIKNIAAFLDAEFKHRKFLNGVIYLHRITDDVAETSVCNLRILQQLCGPRALQNVAIATTRWDEVEQSEGDRREEVLRGDIDFQPFVKGGAQFLRHDGTYDSAVAILDHFTDTEPTALSIQLELAEGKQLDETAAGTELAAYLTELMERCKRQAVDLHHQIDAEVTSQDEVEEMKLEDARKKLEVMMGIIEAEKNNLAGGPGSEREQASIQFQLEEQHLATLVMLQKVKRAVHILRNSYRELAHDLEEVVYNIVTADFWSQRQVLGKEPDDMGKAKSVERFDGLIHRLLEMGFDAPINDVGPVIAIMGPIGTGKSSFIRKLTGDRSIKIDHSVEFDTAEICKYSYLDRGHCVTLIEIPGFDEGNLSFSLLRRIASIFHCEFQNGRPLSGIVYLHRITDNRMGGVQSHFMKTVRKFCGLQALKKVAIVTTRWDEVKDGNEGILREKRLGVNQKFMKPFLDVKVDFFRYTGSFGSARRIMANFLDDSCRART